MKYTCSSRCMYPRRYQLYLLEVLGKKIGVTMGKSTPCSEMPEKWKQVNKDYEKMMENAAESIVLYIHKLCILQVLGPFSLKGIKICDDDDKSI